MSASKIIEQTQTEQTFTCKKCGGTLNKITERIVLTDKFETILWCASCGLKTRFFPELYDKNVKKSTWVTQNCKWCGEKFRVPEWEVRNGRGKFCSKPCAFKGRRHNLTNKIISEETRKKRSERMSGPNNPNWKGGIKSAPYCPKFTDYVKERVRDHFNRECVLCGKPEHKNDQRLAVHHVNYDKGQGCSGEWLLVPLCKICHGKTNGNRDYWETMFTIFLIDFNFNCGLEKTCHICGDVFTPYNGYIKYCSDGCSEISKNEKMENARRKYHKNYRKTPEYLSTLLGSKPTF